jgi:hypothetical protein
MIQVLCVPHLLAKVPPLEKKKQATQAKGNRNAVFLCPILPSIKDDVVG